MDKFNFDGMYEVSHEWSQFEYTLWFKDGKLQRLDSHNKYTDVCFMTYRNPTINQFSIGTNTIQEVVGYLCRNKKNNDIRELLDMFSGDEKYLKVVKETLAKEVELMSKKIQSINMALEK